MKTNQPQQNISKEWEYRELGELLSYEQPTEYIVTSDDYSDEHSIPVLTAGKTFILGYTNENYGIYKKLPVIIFDDFTTAHKYVDFPFKVKSSAMKILKATKEVDIKFIYGWIESHPYTVGEHKRTYLSEYQYQDVYLPPLPEQNRIVSVLETWDKSIEKLSKKIQIKKQIKKGLMQDLLTGKKRVKGFNDKWEIKKLGDLCDIGTGKKNNQDKIESGEYPFFVRSPFIERIDSYSYDGEAILVPGEGNIGKIFHYINGKFDFHQRVYKISNFKKSVSGKYIYFYLLKNFSKATKSDSVKATVDSLRLPTFTNFRINLPSIKEQDGIVNILTTSEKEVTALENKLKMLKEQKRYLLNNLITGTIRTPEKLSIKLIQ